MGCLHLLLLFSLSLIGLSSGALDQAGEEALENVLQQILQIKPGVDAAVIPDKPPKHMLELYQSYTSGAGPAKSHWGTFGASGISMVRSILPSTESGGDVLAFNLSSVRPREVVIEAQLHLHRKRLPRNSQRPRQHLPPPYRIRLLHTTSAARSPRPLSSLLVSPTARGWHVHTITEAVRECRRVSSTTCLLQVTFEEPRTRGGGGNKETRKISPQQFLHENGAFLLLFSEDEYTPITEAGSEHSNSLASLISRSRRSIHDNELPDVAPTSATPSAEVPRRRSSARPPDEEPNTIPYPHSSRWRDGGGGGRRRGGGGGGRKNRRRGHRKADRKLPDVSDEQLQGRRAEETPSGGGGGGGECHVNKLSVTFEDLGMQTWIIAPYTIDVNYCSGRCDLTDKNKLAANNHAVIQRLLHRQQLYDVPAPCCVSEHLSSFNMLMFENDRSVVLRKYHNMTVQSCYCR